MDTLNSPELCVYNKKNKSHTELITKTFINDALPNEFLSRLSNNEVNTNFMILDKETYNKIHKRSEEIAYYLKHIFDIGYINDENTKFGRQTFLYDIKNDMWSKSWKNRSRSYYNKFMNNPDNIVIKNDLSKMIDFHIYSRWKPITNRSSVFTNVILKTSSELPFTNFPKKYKINLNKIDIPQETYNIFKYILEKNKVCGYTQSLNSKLLWIDIDKDPNFEKFNQIMELLGHPRLQYLEYSRYSNGIHGVIKYNQRIPDEFRKRIEEYCKENNVKLECCFHKNILQLFGSVDYSPIDLDIFERYNRIRLLNQLDYRYMYYIYKQIIKRYNTIENDSKILFDLVDGKISKFDIIMSNSSVVESKEEEHIIPKRNYDYITKRPVQYVSKNTNHIKKKYTQFIEAQSGNKYPALQNNIWVCVDKGILDYDEIRKYLEEYKGTSNTISKVSDSEIQRIIDYRLEHTSHSYIKKNYDSSNRKFNSNKKLLSKNLKNIIKDCSYNFSETYYKESKVYYKDKTNSKKHDLKIISKELLYEVIGLFIYQFKNPVDVITPKQANFNKELFSGFSISVSFVNSLLSELKSKNLISNNFDPRKIRDIFIKSFNLIPTFLYDNMKPEIYNLTTNEKILIGYSCFLKGLPIQFKLNNNSIKELEYNIIDFLKIHSNNLNKIYGVKQISLLKHQLLNIYYVKSNFYDNSMLKELEQYSKPPDI